MEDKKPVPMNGGVGVPSKYGRGLQQHYGNYLMGCGIDPRAIALAESIARERSLQGCPSQELIDRLAYRINQAISD